MGLYAIGAECCNNCVHWNCHAERKFCGNPPKEVYTDSNCDKCDLTGRNTLSKDTCKMFRHIGGITSTFKAQEKHASSDPIMSMFDSYDESARSFCQSMATYARDTAAISEARRMVAATKHVADDEPSEEDVSDFAKGFANAMAKQEEANKRASELVHEGMDPKFMFQEKSIEFMQLLDRAKNGNPKAQYDLACAFWDGTHGARDASSLEATNDSRIPKDWCRKAAENGLIDAQYHMGHARLDGDEKSIEWLKEAARQGHSKAKAEFEELASEIAGDSKELLTKCITLLKNRKNDEEIKDAISYIRKASSTLDRSEKWKDSVPLHKLDEEFVDGFIYEIEDIARFGTPELQNTIGKMFGAHSSFEYIVKKDDARAAHWFECAAKAGCLDAMDNLGNCFANGTGVSQSNETAATWYRKAAQGGLDLGQYHYACRLVFGEGVEKDLDEARNWLRKAAEQGLEDAKDRLDILDAESDADNPTCALRAGWKLYKQDNYSAAVRYFRKAAEFGTPEAKYALGYCYYLGKGVEEDEETAAKLFKDATKTWFEDSDPKLAYENMYSDACNCLGACFAKKDVHQAVVHFKKAARCAYAEASKELGCHFLAFRHNTTKDLSQAIYWLQHSIWSGKRKDSYAIEYLEDAKSEYESARGESNWINLLKESAEDFKLAYSGNVDAQVRVGNRFFNGDGVDQKDLNAAAYWWHRAAESGDITAQRLLGKCYESGLGVEKDAAKVSLYYQKATQKGNGEESTLIRSENTLGNCLYGDVMFGLGAPDRDKEECRKIYAEALEGRPGAEYEMGNILSMGMYCILANNKESFAWYLKSAEHGFADAQYEVARAYSLGVEGIIDCNVEKSFKWYWEAAKQGHVESMQSVAYCFYHGLGISKDDDAAKMWYVRAAKTGDNTSLKMLKEHWKLTEDDLQSLYHIVEMNPEGIDCEVEDAKSANDLLKAADDAIKKDSSKAFVLYKKAAARGNIAAIIKLADCYYKGIGTACNDEIAVKWYRKAADLGDADAMAKLGYCYEHNRGVEEDDYEEVAVKWYQKAAENGSKYAMCRLGDMYYEGYESIIDEDKDVAEEWYQKAADLGATYAMLKLHSYYIETHPFDDEYCSKSDELGENAFNAFKEGSKLGDGNCTYYVGMCYFYGTGIEEDKEEALEWFKKATEPGDTQATYALRDCYYKLYCCYDEGTGVDEDDDEAEKWHQLFCKEEQREKQIDEVYQYD